MGLHGCNCEAVDTCINSGSTEQRPSVAIRVARRQGLRRHGRCWLHLLQVSHFFFFFVFCLFNKRGKRQTPHHAHGVASVGLQTKCDRRRLRAEAHSCTPRDRPGETHVSLGDETYHIIWVNLTDSGCCTRVRTLRVNTSH